MVCKSARGCKASVPALICLLLIFTGVHAQLPGTQSAAAPQEVSVDAPTLQRYVGYYKVGAAEPQGLLTVTLAGTQLSIQMTGQPKIDVYARTPTHFFLKVVPAELDFVTDGHGPATALVLHQRGQDVTLARIDAAAAARFNEAMTARVQANAPRPGAEAAVRDSLGRMQRGEPQNYARMSPELAAAAKAQESTVAQSAAALGALQSLTFNGVDPNGIDTFLAKFANASLLVSINLDANGTITGLLLQPAP